MHVDTGDNPPICQKPYTLPLKHYSWVQQEIKTLEHVQESSRKASALGPAQLWWYPRNLLLAKPQDEECVWISEKINKLQPKTQWVDKQMDTQGNLSLIPLPKIDEMYANLCGAKIFTTLDLRSCYYHITLDKESKAKIAFVTPVWQIRVQCSPIWPSASTCVFSTINIHCITGLL